LFLLKEKKEAGKEKKENEWVPSEMTMFYNANIANIILFFQAVDFTTTFSITIMSLLYPFRKNLQSLISWTKYLLSTHPLTYMKNIINVEKF